MSKKVKKAAKAKPKKKAKAAKKATKKVSKTKAAKKVAKKVKAKAAKKIPGRGVTMARSPMTAFGASMILVDYWIEPPAVDMPGVAITFKHVITVNGNDGTDTFHVLFTQITSPNWQIDGPLNRSFPVNGVGIHKFNDGLAFSLKSGRARVKNEVFTVYASGWLASRPTNKLSASIVVTVK